MGVCRPTAICACTTRPSCSRAAATTRGWQWPVLVTPMPHVKSTYSSPSAVVTRQPDALAISIGAVGGLMPCAMRPSVAPTRSTAAGETAAVESERRKAAKAIFYTQIRRQNSGFAGRTEGSEHYIAGK